MSPPTLRDWLRERPFGLALSSGFFGFYAHCGFLLALEQAGLHPRRVTGSSAGALVGGAWASGRSATELVEALLRLRREDFWDPGPGPGLLRGERFQALLDELLVAPRIEACRVPLALSVFDVRARRTWALDRGPLGPAIRASCAVPVMFQPVVIDGRPLLDGGILDRPGLAGMPGDVRVLHHHLPSRTRWFTRLGDAEARPRRAELVSLVLDGLPKVDPFRLGRGPAAIEVARRALTERLDLRLET